MSHTDLVEKLNAWGVDGLDQLKDLAEVIADETDYSDLRVVVKVRFV